MKPYAASIWIGYDKRWPQAFAIARQSARKNLSAPLHIHGLCLQDLIDNEIYTRPIEVRDGRMWDTISENQMSTEFAISRFLVYYLTHMKKKKFQYPRAGWSLFIDCDMLVRKPLMPLFNGADPKYAVMVVKHNHHVPIEDVKMGGQIQTGYARKNWSSVMLLNCDHPSNEKLTLDFVNSARGLALHQFSWLRDEEIGELSPSWNWLAGISSDKIEPHIVHFTDGIPDIPGYENSPYADEWKQELSTWIG